MKKVAIIYWSESGNTEKMAKAIQCGVENIGANLFDVGLMIHEMPDAEAEKRCVRFGSDFTMF